MSIQSLLQQSSVKQTTDTIDKIIAGVLSAPKPKSPSQKSLWQSLFDADITADTAEKLNHELDKLRDTYDSGLMTGPVPTTRKSATLNALKSLKLDAIIVTVFDEYQGEFVPDQARRLLWLTGFAGTAGMCVVGHKKSAMFVDGRYTVQVTEQVSGDDYDYRHLMNDPVAEWIAQNYPAGSRIGFNAHTMSNTLAQSIKDTLSSYNIDFIPLETDPIDMAWDNQPAKPISPVLDYSMDYAGVSTADKHKLLKQTLTQNGADAAIMCLPDSICWLLNIRGGDVPHTPFVHSYAIMTHDDIHLFVNPLKIPSSLKINATVHHDGDYEKFLTTLKGKTVLLDNNTVPYKTVDILTKAGVKIKQALDIAQIPKACKNPVEIEGTRKAHIIDGVAMVKFLHWLDVNAPTGQLDELMCSDKITALRFEHPDMRDVSFNPVSAVESNGAICHYQVSKKTSKPLTMNTLYLVDSGGQYEYGTTDITRTIALGEISNEHRDRTTRVLKGVIALHNIRFPKGTSGMNLDIIARQFLYEGGYNFDHGTGHGVGSYLSVHEGPGRIAPHASPVIFETGMIYSNEPGYYKNGEYGIRLENLIVVTEPDTQWETPMMGFENITWCPFDSRLIDVSMLTDAERQWYNDYHKTTWEKLSPHIDDTDVLAWLKNATKAI